jgi:hypothetical protein
MVQGEFDNDAYAQLTYHNMGSRICAALAVLYGADSSVCSRRVDVTVLRGTGILGYSFRIPTFPDLLRL